MCLVVPLRIGVFINALATMFLSFLMLVDGGNTKARLRIFIGGYTHYSELAITVLDASGLFFGFVGALGAWFNKVDNVKVFCYFQAARVLAWLFTFATDMPLLRTCELWVNNINAMIRAHGWNPTMYEIAMAGSCYSERRDFFIGSVICFLVFLYLVYASFRLLEHMNEVPRHLLRVTKELPQGMFHATRSHDMNARQLEQTQVYGAMQPGQMYGGLEPLNSMVGPPVKAGMSFGTGEPFRAGFH